MARKGRTRRLTPLYLQESRALCRAVSEVIAVLHARHDKSMPAAILVQQCAHLQAELETLRGSAAPEPP